MLHVVVICAEPYANHAVDTALKPLAAELDQHLWGLSPGFHRLAFEKGQVLLTLCVGDVSKLLRQQAFEADFVGLPAAALAGTEPIYAAKAIARLCKPEAVLTASVNEPMLAALRQCGFVVSGSDEPFKATYSPTWRIKRRRQTVVPTTCAVVGSGLAGAAVASSLARRGWAVTVLDAATAPANGASGLPAGLLVPHTSPDDSPLSRLSRAGVRTTLQQARSLLRHGIDWGHTGALQRHMEVDNSHSPLDQTARIQSQSPAWRDWHVPASDRTLNAAGLPVQSPAMWHAQAGWIKPAALVSAWLNADGITWRGGAEVTQLVFTPEGWQLRDAAGQLMGQADLVVLSAGYASQALVRCAGAARPNLQAIRGQVTYGLQQHSDTLPPFVVNGHGGLISSITTPDGPIWLMGAGYERDALVPQVTAQGHADNFKRLQTLLPQAARALVDRFDPQNARGWSGIRCVTPNRLPVVGPVAAASKPGLWMCTGMGSRGLSFAALCGELLAAQLHGEPLPIENQLAKTLQPELCARS